MHLHLLEDGISLMLYIYLTIPLYVSLLTLTVRSKDICSKRTLYNKLHLTLEPARLYIEESHFNHLFFSGAMLQPRHY